MKSSFIKYLFLAVPLLLLSSFSNTKNETSSFPFREMNLTERQAAAHLADRFAFGATPQLLDEITSMGLENWFAQQLKGGLPDADVANRLKDFDALSLTNAEVVAQFPRGPQVRKRAIADGVISKDSLGSEDKASIKKRLAEYKKQKGWRDEKELYRQFVSQKIIRATYSRNQLHEVLTDFWFNHFNVSATKNQCAQFIPAYERDVIRPNVTAKFEQLLMATAKSPAMLLYLDNFNSAIANEEFENKMNEVQTRFSRRRMHKIPKAVPKKGNRKEMALNENYAREIMELHTLGVDGGYTQKDVTEAARVLTGWTIFPFEGYNDNVRKILEKTGESKLKKIGFVHRSDFLFAMNRHDAKEKTVLGKTFKAGGGYQDGVELLHMLAQHPSTANFISKKLAVRFVSDNPPQNLVDNMARVFLKEDGDLKMVLLAMVQSKEFWSAEALRAKTKSPFEYSISAIRVLKGDIKNAMPLFQTISQMGQRLYSYAAPTGFPDRGQYWINTGSLLNRMNFGLALAANRMKGVHVDLLALNQNHEPESAEVALQTYAKLMMPERNLDATYNRLTPLLNKPQLEKRIQQSKSNEVIDEDNDSLSHANTQGEPTMQMNQAVLGQIVGIIVGSPEFQRR